jgi:hypothetical protein
MKDFCEINDLVESVECRMQDAYEQGYETGHKDGEARGIDKMNNLSKEAYAKGLEDAWECARKVMLSCGEGGYDAGTIADIFGMSYHDVLKECKPNKVIELFKQYEEQQKQDDKRELSAKCEKCTKEISAECVVDGCEFEPKQDEKNCSNCGQPRDYKNRCIPFCEGKCVEVPTAWIPKQTDATDINVGSIKVGDEIYSDETDMTAVVHHIDAWGRYQCFNSNGAQFILDKETYDKYWHKTYKYYPQIAEVLEQLRGEE